MALGDTAGCPWATPLLRGCPCPGADPSLAWPQALPPCPRAPPAICCLRWHQLFSAVPVGHGPHRRSPPGHLGTVPSPEARAPAVPSLPCSVPGLRLGGATGCGRLAGVPHAGRDPTAASSPWAGRRAPAAATHTASALFCRSPAGRISSVLARGPPRDAGAPAARSCHESGSGSWPSPVTSLSAGPWWPRLPRPPPWLWPQLTLLELVSCDRTSQCGRGSPMAPARRLQGCPSRTQGGQGAAAMQGSLGAPLGHG